MATLYILESDGMYRPAQEPEVLSSASELLGQRVIGQPVTDPALARDFLRARLAGQEREIFGVLFLDQRHRVLAFEEMFRGTLNGTAVYPREVVKRSLAHNAAAVIFTHNHPSGNPEPSRADEVLTQRLKDALSMVDIRTLDHLVIGREGIVSFSERGLI